MRILGNIKICPSMDSNWRCACVLLGLIVFVVLLESVGHAQVGVADTPEESIELVVPSSGETTYNGQLDGLDYDYFKFTINTPGTVTIYTQSPSGNNSLDPEGELFEGATGNRIAKNDDGGDHKNFRIVKKLSAPGVYYLRVRVYYRSWRSNWEGRVGEYELLLSFQGVPVAYYQDNDGDGYGDPDVSVTQVSPPPDGVWVTRDGDCDDTDATIHPGVADDQCDGIDNDCDGEVDEDADAAMTTYYEDLDGDGYGNPDITKQSCPITSAGWVTMPGDCDDSDASRNPGAIDICGDGVDQDCSDSDRVCGNATVCMDIADAPLTTQIESAPPLVMFLLDDSGSMDFDLLCDTDSGEFLYGNGHSSAYVRGDYNVSYLSKWAADVSDYWVTQWCGYNKVYYNPDVTYTPWPTYSDADPENTRKHPVFSYYIRDYDNWYTKHYTVDMDSHVFTKIGGVTLRYAHYYIKSGSDVYLVNLDGGSAKYYKVGDKGEDGYYLVDSLTEVTSNSSGGIPAGIKVNDYAGTLQNMANWYQFCRNRELAAKSAVAKVISGVSGIKIGLHSINNGKVCEVKSINVDGVDLTDTVLQKLYSVNSTGGTELRSALYEVGQYYDNTDGTENGGIGASPYSAEADGGTCQQAFTIVMTDGYYNGDENFDDVGNADADSGAETDESEWDGAPYEDSQSNTLADVAMYFYERDLRTDLNDFVPVTDADKNNQQHMVTYTLAFGVTGTLTPSQYDCPAITPGSDDPVPNCPGATDKPAWPDPGSSDKAKIDDLYHAAVNGRGKFLSAGNSEALVTALLALMEEIQNRVMTGASVTMNSQELETDSQLYQGFFDSSNWSGDLKAYSLNEDASGNVSTAEAWSAQNVFKGKALTWWNTGRNILTYNGASGIRFRYNNLTDDQKAYLSSSLVDYIRGDSESEEAKGGAFRDRDGLLLGDIVNSSPVFENGVVYVGANDGMLHAFDATTGSELFAYIPSFLIGNLSNLADPNYSHSYYVDNTIYTRTVKTGTNPQTVATWLVGGLGKGGRGYYGIKIDEPSGISEGDIPVIWEYPKSSVPDNDMGYSYSVPTIVKSNTGENVIIFGNGYDSPGGKAFLYVLKLDGTLLRKIPTLAGSPVPADGKCNGLSVPVPIDSDYNGTMDVVYAGDLLGNMWKFDLSATDSDSWGVDYGGKPLFTAKNKDGQIQPIVGKPSVMTHCKASRKGVIVLFGTGRYLAYEDTSNTEIQSIYGIWDWADAWENPDTRYFGSFGVPTGDPATRALSNFDGVSLLHQWVNSGDNTLINSSSNSINWFCPAEWAEAEATSQSYTGGTDVGWYLDLPSSGERMITKTQLVDGVAVVVSIVPKNSPCTAGGGSVIYMLNACSGGQPNDEFFDQNGDGLVNSDDGIYSGKRYPDDIYYAPAIVNNSDGDTDKMFLSKDEQIDIKKELMGIFYWRFVE